MAYDFSAFEKRAADIADWLQKEFNTVRTGRATPTLLDGVTVESYGTHVPIVQVGTVGVEDARTLRVSVWDTGQVKAVENAIIDADLGVSVVVDEKGLRVVFPEVTGERREQLLKIAKGKFEEARVQLRGARDDTMKRIEGEKMSEDETFRAKETMEKHMERAQASLQALFENKEKEIKQ